MGKVETSARGKSRRRIDMILFGDLRKVGVISVGSDVDV